MGGNFKVRCIESGYLSDITTGKTYSVINGKLIDNVGTTRPCGSRDIVNTISELNEYWDGVKWELVESGYTQHIAIRQKGRKVVAVLTDADGKFIKSAKALCNPTDTFDFEIGKKLAVKRLLGLDTVIVTNPSEPAAASPRIVKQDKYEVGDKVKLFNVRPSTWNHAGQMDKFLGKEVIITKAYGNNFEFEGSKPWAFSFHNSIEGKVIEVTHTKLTAPSFNWESFKFGKFAVHCDTEEKAKAFLKECDEHGIKWNSGGTTTSHTHYSDYGSNTCYSTYVMGYGRLGRTKPDYYKDNGVNVIDYTPSKPTIKEVKRPAKVGEWIKVVHCHGYGYKNGDIAQVEELQFGNKAIIHANGDYYGYKNQTVVALDEYVVLENYQSESVLVKPGSHQPTTSMREVKRQAETGEFVKVINAFNVPRTDDKDEYSNGDILKIISGDNYQVRYANGTAGNGNERLLCESEYVVLENFDYSVFPKNEPWKKAKVGDKIRIVKINMVGGHGPEVKIGDEFIVSKVDADSVAVERLDRRSRNWFFDWHTEYIIIEEAKDTINVGNSSNTIGIGDSVKVVGAGRVCTVYEKFIQMFAKDFIGKYNHGYSPKKGDIGIVVGSGEHEIYHETYYAVLANDKVFCIGGEGIEKVRA